MIYDVVPNRNTVTHRKPRDYDRINTRGFDTSRLCDPIIAFNAASKKAANKKARLINGEQRKEVIQDAWDAIAERMTMRRDGRVVRPCVKKVTGQVWNGREYI